MIELQRSLIGPFGLRRLSRRFGLLPESVVETKAAEKRRSSNYYLMGQAHVF
jgi:hypothetical protein